MKLSNTAAKAAKPREKAYKLADGGGLYLEVHPNGSKLWRLKYRRPGGKETRVSLGPYPAVSIAAARAKREELKQQRREGIDPAAERKADKLRKQHAATNSFEAVAGEWLDKISATVTPAYLKRMRRRFERDLFPYLGSRPINDLDAAELLSALQRIEQRGAVDTAHRARGECGALFRYAIATGRTKHDVAASLRGALTPHQKAHFPSIRNPAEVGALLRALHGYQGTPEVRAALQLAPLVFVRPIELRSAEWAEFDLNAAEWRIPAAKMKMRTPHIVPLADQVVAILRDLHNLTGGTRFLFPGVRSRRRPMSENTVNAALRRLGYDKDTMTGHGFRSLASTLLHEQGFRSELIERQLAHAERNSVAAAYNFAEFLPDRRKMMQAWADYLDNLREGRNVVAGDFGRAA